MSAHTASDEWQNGTGGGGLVGANLEIEDGKVSRFRAYFDPRRLTEQIVA